MLKENTWNIFEIAKENSMDIGVGMDMFVSNLNAGRAVYHGADELDYAALHDQWAALSAGEQAAAKQEYSDFSRAHYAALSAARRAEDKEAFDRIVG